MSAETKKKEKSGGFWSKMFGGKEKEKEKDKNKDKHKNERSAAREY